MVSRTLLESQPCSPATAGSLFSSRAPYPTPTPITGKFYSCSLFMINHFVSIAAPLAGRGSAEILCLLAVSTRYVPGLERAGREQPCDSKRLSSAGSRFGWYLCTQCQLREQHPDGARGNNELPDNEQPKLQGQHLSWGLWAAAKGGGVGGGGLGVLPIDADILLPKAGRRRGGVHPGALSVLFLHAKRTKCKGQLREGNENQPGWSVPEAGWGAPASANNEALGSSRARANRIARLWERMAFDNVILIPAVLGLISQLGTQQSCGHPEVPFGTCPVPSCWVMLPGHTLPGL